jgi:hypothetical protein
VLLTGELEGEVGREALYVSLYRLGEHADGHVVQGGEVRVEDDPSTAQDQERPLYTLQ